MLSMTPPAAASRIARSRRPSHASRTSPATYTASELTTKTADTPSSVATGRAPGTASARGAAAAIVGTGLHATAADRHRAPGAARVARAVVEGPAADLARARLQARPAAVEHRGER